MKTNMIAALSLSLAAFSALYTQSPPQVTRRSPKAFFQIIIYFLRAPNPKNPNKSFTTPTHPLNPLTRFIMAKYLHTKVSTR
jgi:hypothetical protein